jgi:hypothetical protein
MPAEIGESSKDLSVFLVVAAAAAIVFSLLFFS